GLACPVSRPRPGGRHRPASLPQAAAPSLVSPAGRDIPADASVPEASPPTVPRFSLYRGPVRAPAELPGNGPATPASILPWSLCRPGLAFQPAPACLIACAVLLLFPAPIPLPVPAVLLPVPVPSSASGRCGG